MATQNYTELAQVTELSQIASDLIDEHDGASREALVQKLVNITIRAVTDNLRSKQYADTSLKLPEGFEGINLCTASGSLYTFAEGVTKLDLKDHLGARLIQLEAMLTMVCGGGAESFHQWSEDTQSNYLWACSTMATECKELVHLI